MGGPDFGDPVTLSQLARPEEAEEAEALIGADGLVPVALGIEIGVKLRCRDARAHPTNIVGALVRPVREGHRAGLCRMDAASGTGAGQRLVAEEAR